MFGITSDTTLYTMKFFCIFNYFTIVENTLANIILNYFVFLIIFMSGLLPGKSAGFEDLQRGDDEAGGLPVRTCPADDR